MREIKFRAILTKKWNTKKTGEWIYFTIKDLDNNLSRLPINWNTLGQFTGLHDKNGKEIYEGDIVHFLDEKVNKYHPDKVVKWVKSGWNMKQKHITKDGTCLGTEVIGNIHSNPELLK